MDDFTKGCVTFIGFLGTSLFGAMAFYSLVKGYGIPLFGFSVATMIIVIVVIMDLVNNSN